MLIIIPNWQICPLWNWYAYECLIVFLEFNDNLTASYVKIWEFGSLHSFRKVSDGEQQQLWMSF